MVNFVADKKQAVPFVWRQLRFRTHQGIQHSSSSLLIQSSNRSWTKTFLHDFRVLVNFLKSHSSFEDTQILGNWHCNGSVCPHFFGGGPILLLHLVGRHTALILFGHLLLEVVDPWPHSPKRQGMFLLRIRSNYISLPHAYIIIISYPLLIYRKNTCIYK